MAQGERPSGIKIIGQIPWGTHLGLFYRSKQDLIDILVPYFKAGLENNEFCMWVTAEPLDPGEVKALMADALPDFQSYLDKGQIEIIPYTEWYTAGGTFNADRVLNGWVDKLQEAEKRGFNGLRLTGNESWLDRSTWRDFIEYEHKINDVVGRYRMIILCAYPEKGGDASDVLDVAGTHQFVLAKRNGEWKRIEDMRHRRTREALQESEEKFRMLADSSQAGIVLVQDEKIVYVNQALADIGGYTIDECLNNNFLDFIHSDFRELLQRRNHAAQRGRDIVQHRYQVKIIRKDGGERWIDFSPGQCTYNGIPALIITALDITDRKQAEEALQFERLQLLNIFYSVDEVIYVADPYTHEILYANKAMRDKFGKELIGGTCYREIQERDAPCDFCTNAIILKNKGEPYRWEFHNPIVNRDFEIVDRIIRWPDGRDVRFEMAMDITGRKRTEEALRESKFDLARSQEIAHLGSWKWDIVRDRIIWSDETYRLFGLEPGKFVPHHNDFMSFIHPGDRVRAEKAMRDALIHGTYKVDLRIVRKGGEERWVHSEGSTTFDDKGNPVKIEGTVLDITDRKRSEEDLLMAKQQAELYLDLMGHDINNLHQIALGYLELAKDIPPGEDRLKFIDKPVEVLQRSAQLISNVRKLQKLRDGAFQTRDVDVSRLLVDLQREFGAVPGKLVMLNVNGHGHCFVMANELLHDVFANLLSNAIKHTGDGTNITVDLDIMKDNGSTYCRVSVEDNGPGIPDDRKGVIFNRALRSTAKAKGMGLGLYLVKSLVDSYGGKVWVEDRVKGDYTKGARFVVTLPAVGE